MLDNTTSIDCIKLFKNYVNVCDCDNCLFELHHLIGQWKLIKRLLDNWNIEYLCIFFLFVEISFFLFSLSQVANKSGENGTENIMTSTHRIRANKDWIDDELNGTGRNDKKKENEKR